MDIIEARQSIQKISIDMENMSYQINKLQDDIASLNATVSELKGAVDERE
tara:strand:+ start:1633 stop:1782 length:150 start_codon:yes stop_codon:yes gene_type:complete